MTSRLAVCFSAPVVAVGCALAGGALTPVHAAADTGSSPLGPVVSAAANVATPAASAVRNGVAAASHEVRARQAAGATGGTASGAAAPGGSASGVGVRLDPLNTCVSCTSATAQQGSSKADATSIRLAGVDVAAGSTTTTTSTGSGSVFTLPVNPVVGLAIAHWLTSAQASSDSSRSHSRAALVDVDLLNGQVATIAVLEAVSDASWTPSRSTASSQTNGVNASIINGALVLVLLHSRSSSDGNSSVYLIGVNGNQIGTASNGQGVITIPIPGVTTITLLQTGATGGNGTTGSGGAVGTVSDTLPSVTGGGETGQVLGASTVATNGSVASGPAPGGGVQGLFGNVPNTAGPSVVAQAGGVGTPVTGAGVRLVGLAMLAVGLAMAALLPRRRRRTT